MPIYLSTLQTITQNNELLQQFTYNNKCSNCKKNCSMYNTYLLKSILNQKIQDLDLCNKTYQIYKLNKKNIKQQIDIYNCNQNIITNNTLISNKINEYEQFIIEINNRTFDDYTKYQDLHKLNETLSKEKLGIQLQLSNLYNEKDKIDIQILQSIDSIDKSNQFKILQEDSKKINIEFCNIDLQLNTLKKNNDTLNIHISNLQTQILDNQILLAANELITEERDILIDVNNIINNGLIDDILTHSVIPDLENSVNSLLTAYSHFQLHIQYSNKQITIFKKIKNNVFSSIRKLSGCETLIANIVFRLVLNAKNRLHQTNFFIIDEGFSFL